MGKTDPGIALLEAAEDLDEAEAEEFAYRCGVARADAVDRVLIAVVEDLGWSLFDEDIPDRVVVEHDGDRARILVDGAPASPWWNDRLRCADGKRIWSFEPEPEGSETPH